MFDDENENENWDNIDVDISDTSADEQSWDEILDNAIVHDDFDDNENINNESTSYDNEQGQFEDNTVQNSQTYDVIDDEPIVEASTQSRETDNVSETYAEAEVQQEDEIQSVQNEEIAQNNDYIETKDTQPQENTVDLKPIGIPQDKKNTQTPVVLGIVVAIIFAFAGYMGYTYLKENGMVPDNQTVQNNVQETQGQEDEDLFGDMGTNQDNMDVTENVQEQETVAVNNEDKVVVSIVNVGRPNPFTPTGNFSEAGYTVPKGLDIMGTPSLDKEMAPNKLVDIVVSGILYDSTKPSAIITIGGIDHFVQRGDSIDEYVVSYIGPTSVTIRSGKNTYTASIGQQFNVNDRIQGETTFVKGKNGTTRQYFTPSENDITE